MSFSNTPALTSYAKTAVVFVGLVLVALLDTLLGWYWLQKVVGTVVVAIGVLVALGAAVLTCASAVVLIRYQRSVRGKRDLFLELNRTREATAFKAGAFTTTRPRRWLAQRLLGNDLLVGDLVEVKTWDEIRATLDAQGCLQQLPFMPEMLTMCGRHATVFRCVHRVFDYRKTRRMRHLEDAVLLMGTMCDGSSHGGCTAACHTIWKSAWLRRLDRSKAQAEVRATPSYSSPLTHPAVLRFGTQAPRYACQLTQLHAASQPIGRWSAANFLRPLISGNVAPSAFVVGWLTYIFDEIQHLRQGVSFPAFEDTAHEGGSSEETRLEAGDQVLVRSSGEILATLNDQFMHRGLWFEPDMLKHCGRRYGVQAQVTQLIDIVTGEMRTMKTPAYILRDVYFSGERQLFNAQCEPLYWRGVWLQRVEH